MVFEVLYLSIYLLILLVVLTSVTSLFKIAITSHNKNNIAIHRKLKKIMFF
jgi:uncharacterized metal-binding protein